MSDRTDRLCFGTHAADHLIEWLSFPVRKLLSQCVGEALQVRARLPAQITVFAPMYHEPEYGIAPQRQGLRT